MLMMVIVLAAVMVSTAMMMKEYVLGRELDDKGIFRLLEQHLNTHMAVFGATGSGKSRFLWQLMREHRRNRRGFTLIDPGDLGDDFLADCAREVLDTGNRDLLKKIHLLQLNPFQLARYDPLRFNYPRAVHPEFLETVRISWQHAKVQSVAEVFQRKQNQFDFEGMPRLQRIMTNVLTCLATLVQNKRLSLADAYVLVDVYHPRHLEVYDFIAPHLPREIAADFDVLHSFKRVEDVRRETESSVNRFRSLFGPLLKLMLSGTGAEPTLDLYKIVQRGDYLIVNVSRSPFASREQNIGLAGLVIHDLFETMLVTPREKRRNHTLIIDESHMFLGEDLGESGRVMRKYGLGLVMATPDLASLRKKDLDLTPAILGVPETIVAFRMKWPEDTEPVIRVVCTGDLDFTPLEQEVERDDGYKFPRIQETSRNETVTNTVGDSDSEQEGTTISHQESSQSSHGKTSGRTESSQAATGGVGTHSRPRYEVDRAIRPEQVSRATSKTAAAGAAVSNTNTETQGSGISDGTAKTSTRGKTHQQSVSRGVGVTVSEKVVPLHQVKREKQKTGQLERSVNDQLEEKRKKLVSQSKRQALVKVPDKEGSIQIETLEVKNPFVSIEAQIKAVDAIKRDVYAEHDYYFTPNLAPKEEDARINGFLKEENVPLIVESTNEEDPTA